MFAEKHHIYLVKQKHYCLYYDRSNDGVCILGKSEKCLNYQKSRK